MTDGYVDDFDRDYSVVYGEMTIKRKDHYERPFQCRVHCWQYIVGKDQQFKSLEEASKRYGSDLKQFPIHLNSPTIDNKTFNGKGIVIFEINEGMHYVKVVFC
jgi:hypothetical protein